MCGNLTKSITKQTMNYKKQNKKQPPAKNKNKKAPIKQKS